VAARAADAAIRGVRGLRSPASINAPRVFARREICRFSFFVHKIIQHPQNDA
jgi:hypothetical protein